MNRLGLPKQKEVTTMKNENRIPRRYENAKHIKEENPKSWDINLRVNLVPRKLRVINPLFVKCESINSVRLNELTDFIGNIVRDRRVQTREINNCVMFTFPCLR